jgi:hypothetical protein
MSELEFQPKQGEYSEVPKDPVPEKPYTQLGEEPEGIPESSKTQKNDSSDLKEEEKINLVKRLYKDIKFSGSFSGINNMQRSIFLETGTHLSRSLIHKALNEIPTYVQHLRPVRTLERSKYKVTAFGEVCQADIAYMFDFEGFKYFLLLIDLFSHRIFTRAQKTKNKLETLHSLQDIIGKENLEIYTLQTDQGMEFKGNKTILKKMKIHWREKVGQNKASFAEQVNFAKNFRGNSQPF